MLISKTKMIRLSIQSDKKIAIPQTIISFSYSTNKNRSSDVTEEKNALQLQVERNFKSNTVIYFKIDITVTRRPLPSIARWSSVK